MVKILTFTRLKLLPQLAFHLCAFAFRRAFQAVEQFCPVDFAGVADDVQMRHAAAFDEVVAVLSVDGGGDAVQFQHAVREFGAEAEFVVGEAVQHADELVDHEVAAAIADAREVGDGFVADTPPSGVVRRRVQAGAEVLRPPVGEDDVFGAAFDTPFDFADAEGVGQLLQVEAREAQVEDGERRVAEKAADVQAFDLYVAVKDGDVYRLAQLQAVAREADVGQGAANHAAKAHGVERFAEVGEADGVDVRAQFVVVAVRFKAADGDAAVQERDAQRLLQGDAACVPAQLRPHRAHRQFVPARAGDVDA